MSASTVKKPEKKEWNGGENRERKRQPKQSRGLLRVDATESKRRSDLVRGTVHGS